ncbi:uncharacterized protein EAE98_011876 [Botrytis deweyae]|uniref:Secreted protein n=1 Tax=Botrytis deweyae TaxID=2478750 RepID=A0ABQ7I4N7_9HELO|nr:uncharacterized protein EAE98_011876 [Botrytis deweyae]KAF7911761.1 hypothetical protein EAE98_011876 [Botrytis deweyae]
MNFLPLFATTILASCVILVVSAIPQHAFFPRSFSHEFCPTNPDDASKCNLRLTVTVYDTNKGMVDLKITGPKGCPDCGVYTSSNGIPWAAMGNKPRCFYDKGTWDLTVGRDSQVPDVVTWGGVKYPVNKVDRGNMNSGATRITTYNMPFKCTL